MSSFSLEIHSFTSVTGFSKNTASSSPPKILFLFVSFELCLFLLPQTRRVSKTKTPKTRPEIPKPISAQHRFRFGEKKTIQEIPFPPRSLRSHEQSPGRLFCFFLFREILGVFCPPGCFASLGKVRRVLRCEYFEELGIVGNVGIFFLANDL